MPYFWSSTPANRWQESYCESHVYCANRMSRLSSAGSPAMACLLAAWNFAGFSLIDYIKFLQHAVIIEPFSSTVN
jgi:hypothetical protein